MKIEKRELAKFDTLILEEDTEQFFTFCKHAYKAESTERLHEWLNKALMWSVKCKNLTRKVLRYRSVQALMKSLGVQQVTIGVFLTHTHNLSTSYTGGFHNCGITASILLSYDMYACGINGQPLA